MPVFAIQRPSRGIFHLPSLVLAALALVAAAANAQPASREYDDLSWTGGAERDAVMRKEAGAALAEGRRQCARIGDRDARQSCLQLVQQDYREMMARVRDEQRPRARPRRR